MPKGGKRIPGPGKRLGRPAVDPSGETRKIVRLFVTASEESKLREHLEYMRQKQNEPD